MKKLDQDIEDYMNRTHPEPPPELQMEQEPRIYTRSEMIEVLAQLYAGHPSDVAVICDEALDKSGRLLGDVRAKAREITGR